MKLACKILVGVFTGVGLIMLCVGLIMGAAVQRVSPGTEEAVAFTVLNWVFSLLGGALLIAGLTVAAVMRRSDRRRAELMSYGRRVTGTVITVEHNPFVQINNRHPLRVVAECVHPLTGETVTVRSHSLRYCDVLPGQKVDVVFDPMNEKKYVVDVAEGKRWGFA